MAMYRVIETVAVDYIYIVEAESEADAVHRTKFLLGSHESVNRHESWDDATYQVEEMEEI